MSYLVNAADLAQVKLNLGDTVGAVLQNVALILATPQGSAPLYRSFGLSQDFVDKPMPVAKAMLVTAVREAIEEWEPRATVKDIRFAEDAAEPGQLSPTVEVEVDLEA